MLARAFGEQLVLGDERWIEVSKAADELLLETACKQRKRVAYTVGRASTSGTFANAQGFLAGTTASLLSVREVKRKAGGTGVTSVLVRGEGRVVLQSVKAMKPSIVATALPLRDGGIATLLLRKCSVRRSASQFPVGARDIPNADARKYTRTKAQTRHSHKHAHARAQPTQALRRQPTGGITLRS